MKNPIYQYYKNQIDNFKKADEKIFNKKQEIEKCKKELDEIKHLKESTSFKWYDIKSKTNFNDEIKAKKKQLKAEINEYEKELFSLEAEKTEAKNKKERLFIFTGVIALILIFSIIITIGVINEKKHPDVQLTTAVTEETSTEESTTEETTLTTTEKASESESSSTNDTTYESKSKVDTTTSTTQIANIQNYNSNDDSNDNYSSQTVYITDKGKKYHTQYCRTLKKSKHEISKSSAIAQGYDPCSICNP